MTHTLNTIAPQTASAASLLASFVSASDFSIEAQNETVYPVGNIQHGEYTNVAYNDSGLLIALQPAGRDYLLENRAELSDNADFALLEFLEGHTANGELSDVRPEEIGALYSGLILTMTAERDDWGNLVSIGKIYYDSDYVYSLAIETLLEKGFVIFPSAPEAPENDSFDDPTEPPYTIEGGLYDPTEAPLQAVPHGAYIQHGNAGDLFKRPLLWRFAKGTAQLRLDPIASIYDDETEKRGPQVLTGDTLVNWLQKRIVFSDLQFIEAVSYPVESDGFQGTERLPRRFYVASNNRADGYPYSVVYREGSGHGCDITYSAPVEVSTHWEFSEAGDAAYIASKVYGDPSYIPAKFENVNFNPSEYYAEKNVGKFTPEGVTEVSESARRKAFRYGSYEPSHLKKTLTIGRTERGHTVTVEVILTMTARGLKLSMTGEAKYRPHQQPNHCGQIYDVLTDDIKTYSMPKAKVEEIAAIWKEWHMNDSTSHCSHIDMADYRKKLTVPRSYPYTSVVTGEKFTTEEKAASWVRQSEHPEGYLSRPCDCCGYKQGTSWLFRTIPHDIIAKIKAW